MNGDPFRVEGPGLPSGFIGKDVNDYGTPVSVLRCSECGRVVTVCPALPAERQQQWGTGCLADDCPSYSLDRDADIFFEPMAEAGLIRREAL